MQRFKFNTRICIIRKSGEISIIAELRLLTEHCYSSYMYRTSREAMLRDWLAHNYIIQY